MDRNTYLMKASRPVTCRDWQSQALGEGKGAGQPSNRETIARWVNDEIERQIPLVPGTRRIAVRLLAGLVLAECAFMHQGEDNE